MFLFPFIQSLLNDLSAAECCLLQTIISCHVTMLQCYRVRNKWAKQTFKSILCVCVCVCNDERNHSSVSMATTTLSDLIRRRRRRSTAAGQSADMKWRWLLDSQTGSGWFTDRKWRWLVVQRSTLLAVEVNCRSFIVKVSPKKKSSDPAESWTVCWQKHLMAIRGTAAVTDEP